MLLYEPRYANEMDRASLIAHLTDLDEELDLLEEKELINSPP
jgi:hypothetical protein